MAIGDMVGAALDGPVTAVRRHVVSIAIAVAAGIGALFYAASAGMLALEALTGPILARVIVAVVLLLVAVGGYFAPRLFASHPRTSEEPAAADEALTRDQRLAMVFEALLLGFSMGSRKPASADGRK